MLCTMTPPSHRYKNRTNLYDNSFFVRMRSPTLFLLLLLVPLALCHVFSEPADLELKSYQALEKSLKEMGLIRANQGPQKACGRSMMMKVQKLCAGGCTIQNDGGFLWVSLDELESFRSYHQILQYWVHRCRLHLGLLPIWLRFLKISFFLSHKLYPYTSLLLFLYRRTKTP